MTNEAWFSRVIVLGLLVQRGDCIHFRLWSSNQNRGTSNFGLSLEFWVLLFNARFVVEITQ